MSNIESGTTQLCPDVVEIEVNDQAAATPAESAPPTRPSDLGIPFTQNQMVVDVRLVLQAPREVPPPPPRWLNTAPSHGSVIPGQPPAPERPQFYTEVLTGMNNSRIFALGEVRGEVRGPPGHAIDFSTSRIIPTSNISIYTQSSNSTPTSTSNSTPPSTSNSTRRPSASNSTRRPSVSNSTRGPSASNSTRRPSASNSTRRPSASNSTRRPSASNSTRRPSASNSSRPSALNMTRRPLALNSSRPSALHMARRPLASNIMRSHRRPRIPMPSSVAHGPQSFFGRVPATRQWSSTSRRPRRVRRNATHVAEPQPRLPSPPPLVLLPELEDMVHIAVSEVISTSIWEWQPELGVMQRRDRLPLDEINHEQGLLRGHLERPVSDQVMEYHHAFPENTETDETYVGPNIGSTANSRRNQILNISRDVNATTLTVANYDVLSTEVMSVYSLDNLIHSPF